MPEFIADFHIHSKYSRATSANMDIPHIARWAKLKGISVMGTGDFTHPLWLKELKTFLVEEKQGLYKHSETYFILTAEVNNIFTKKGKGYRVHNIIFAPDFSTVEKINFVLSKYANLSIDGRPVLPISAKELVKLVLDISQDCLIVPAHIWTPWFSILGSNSGFDSIYECFDEQTDNIYALETGLSSDPPMNWRLSALDRFTLISNSDSHSPKRIGRESNFFNTEIDYYKIIEVIKNKDRTKFLFTIEFFPEEGKYHYDGHRECGVVLSPEETKTAQGICPVCKRNLTIGVMHRVELLADRQNGYIPENAISYRYVIPLDEIISDILQKGINTEIVEKEYYKLINLAPEFELLLRTPISEIAKVSEPVANGISLMRKNQVKKIPGYDGVYGKISLLTEQKQETPEQLSLF